MGRAAVVPFLIFSSDLVLMDMVVADLEDLAETHADRVDLAAVTVDQEDPAALAVLVDQAAGLLTVLAVDREVAQAAEAAVALAVEEDLLDSPNHSHSLNRNHKLRTPSQRSRG